MNTIETITINEFPLVILTDSHTNIANVRKLQELYPTHKMICLGDITFLFAKQGETFNRQSIEFFMQSGIPTLMGNHEEHIVACAKGGRKGIVMIKADEHSSLFDEYGLSPEHIKYLESLPRGFKLILPDGYNYYCFHNRPNDLWSHTEQDSLSAFKFLEIYPVERKTLGVIIGHQHTNYIRDYGDALLISVGQICGSNHHTGAQNGNNYALLTEKGVEFKKLA